MNAQPSTSTEGALMSAISPLAEAVRRRRIELGLTQEAMAERAGFSPQTAKNIERGTSVQLRAVTLHGLDRALEWDLGTALRIMEGGAAETRGPARDEHFTNPPPGGLHLDSDQLASLKVLLDLAVPREPGTSTDWEGVGRRYHESILGFRAPCTCQVRLAGTPPQPGCPVHDPNGADQGCVFCAIVAGTAPAEVVQRTDTTVTLVPLNPVAPGHVITIPRRHVVDAAADPVCTGDVMSAAAAYAATRQESFNLITSAGEAATQSVFHLHVHYVPRAAGDGLVLPWTGQERAA